MGTGKIPDFPYNCRVSRIQNRRLSTGVILTADFRRGFVLPNVFNQSMDRQLQAFRVRQATQNQSDHTFARNDLLAIVRNLFRSSGTQQPPGHVECFKRGQAH